MIIALAGLPGTGKSYLAHALAKAHPMIILDKDQIRAHLFPGEYTVYTRQQDDLCVNIMLQVSAFHLQMDPSRIIILDGRPFLKTYQVDHVINAAQKMKTPLYWIECTASDETIKHRTIQDYGIHPAKNRTWEWYLSQKQEAEALTVPTLRIATDEEASELAVARVLEYIRPSMLQAPRGE